MLRRYICLWTLCFLSSVLLEGDGSPLPKGKTNAIKGNREFDYHYV